MRSRENGPAPILDEVSKRIIDQLQEDGRRPYAAIGKAVGLSEAAVRQRVQRLLESGVMQIVAVTDPLQVGFSRQAMIGLRTAGDLTEVADRIAAMPEVDYVVVTAGSFDILVRGRLRGRRRPAEAGQHAHPHAPGGRQHRDLRLSQAPQTALQLGNTMTTTPQDTATTTTGAARTPLGSSYADAARDHLWMHFTRHSTYENGGERAGHRAR